MNKTVNINLAGIFFHIDEDAYLKLQRYLDAIKRSFTDSEGRSEIIADIEARIAELFSQRVKHDKQVIGNKEVDEVIAIMGQPEDYLVDDEIFEDEPKENYKAKKTHSKKLFRDPDNRYIGGVSSGLGHYLGIDAIWIRFAWIILFSVFGTGILLYILLWILLPEAKTTAEKIMMTGEPVNISNIEKKIKDGFDTVSKTVSDTVKNVDLPKQGQRIKSTSKSFFDNLGSIIMFFLKVFAKFIGIILMIAGASTLIGLIVALFSVGILNNIHITGWEYLNIVNAGDTPIWLVSLLLFFTIGIPFFFLFYLGLKILINNLKSIGNIAKFTLLGLWLISIIGLIIIGVKQASEHAFTEKIIEKTELKITNTDTIYVKMNGSDYYGKHHYNNSFKIANNENGDKMIYRSYIKLFVKSTHDTIAKINISKSAQGGDYDKAIERAKKINYHYELRNKTLLLDSYLTTNPKNKFSNQGITITLFLPEGSVVNFDKNTKSFFNYSKYDNYLVSSNDVNHNLKILENDITCLDCDNEKDLKLDINIKDEDNSIKINAEGIKIKADGSTIEISSKGITGNIEDVNVNSDSLNIKSKNK
ncbi:hypothetical protein APS56_07715 [Pseudalgibacter alginicilyticus]|uniref:Uncharacterized protein n=1 Tax=Pseudalgibacter alginicilyticus TaxID=1736674 RepID=A0A0P0CKS0_9FLAO|nr:PspC domain-containing protein [Pseudalgibacter alginicilyticus]ALJ05017.1 hypothetical protein APS56_07715 [Pseudalgibacter alginicilyticus]